jgi:hypothetical protein
MKHANTHLPAYRNLYGKMDDRDKHDLNVGGRRKGQLKAEYLL